MDFPSYMSFTAAVSIFSMLVAAVFPGIPGADRITRMLNSRLALIIALTLSPAMILWTWYIGNIHFGAFDHSVLIDTAWRLWNGQKPYQDFICTLPPGFFIGAKYAFQLFGPSWNAQLYFCGVFAAATFLWLYWLFARLLSSRALALIGALAIEGTTSLIVAYWWYNPITSIAASIFLLSAFLCCADPEELAPSALLSLGGSFFLLLLMKPNISLPLGFGVFGALFCFSKSRWRILLTGVAASIVLTLFLRINDVGVRDLIESYIAIAKGRARPGFGFHEMGWLGTPILAGRLSFLAFPLIYWIPHAKRNLRERNRAETMRLLLFPLATFVGLYGMATNGELTQVDMPLLIAGGIVTFFLTSQVKFPTPDWGLVARRLYLGFIFGLIASSLYAGAIRQRVERIGEFFASDEDRISAGQPFFQHLTAPYRFQEVLKETQKVLADNKGRSIFFGPRMEFSYATFNLQSPRNLPVWWHPGTSFDAAQVDAMIQRWDSHKFDVLIFLKHDTTYYSSEFKALLHSRYVFDNAPDELTHER